ncbi:unnamed protein product [Lactuca saligna]|uniref:Uncharacterized protein n=1 Tax=Lactuca saligna TaxID=75948 RepID=A0AA35YTP0_LACSI|nr:unnamed protein product [Lactuca saligna]
MDQNLESTFTESSPVIQDILSPLPESTPMDQDFQCPIIKEVVLPSEGAQASGGSFEAPESDISKGKSKLPEIEFDIRISKLEKENYIKDANISELQANLGGLTALFFDLKQQLHLKFGDEFQPLSAKGEKIYASSSGAANPTSQSSSERAVRPAPYQNLDIFFYLLVLLLLKKEERSKLRETKKKYIDKYGDGFGIIMWGNDSNKRMWVVKRKSGRIEYYEKKVDFLSGRKVDLSKLIHTPFHNPTNDTMA